MKKKEPLPKEEIERLVKKAGERLSTPEGQEELRQAFARGEENARKIREAYNKPISIEEWRTPLGPRGYRTWEEQREALQGQMKREQQVEQNQA